MSVKVLVTSEIPEHYLNILLAYNRCLKQRESEPVMGVSCDDMTPEQCEGCINYIGNDAKNTLLVHLARGFKRGEISL